MLIILIYLEIEKPRIMTLMFLFPHFYEYKSLMDIAVGVLYTKLLSSLKDKQFAIIEFAQVFRYSIP